MTTQLGPAQHAILAHAINHTSGQIDWFPDHIKGGARKKVIDAMFNRALIINDGTNWIVANEGYEALGMARAIAVIEVASDIDPKIEAAVTAIEAAACAETKTPRTRDTSKQATVIRMLKRPEGATIPQIMAATGWLSHTVRGTFAGTFKKKLGLTLASDKGEGVRVYRIAD